MANRGAYGRSEFKADDAEVARLGIQRTVSNRAERW
jgi:hypothetical protein